eukprot:363761-Chlamydomonas_euryale.AAC.17
MYGGGEARRHAPFTSGSAMWARANLSCVGLAPMPALPPSPGNSSEAWAQAKLDPSRRTHQPASSARAAARAQPQTSSWCA